jgi:hypothetical protein
VVYEMETGRTDFVGDWVLNDVAIRHRTPTHARARVRTHIYIHTHVRTYMEVYTESCEADLILVCFGQIKSLLQANLLWSIVNVV